MTRRLLTAPLLLVTLLLFACGGDDKPEPRALLSEMFAKTGQQKVISGTVKTTIVGEEETLELVQDVIVEPAANKGYVKTASELFSLEVVLDGPRAWVRESSDDSWTQTTSAAVGIKADSIAGTADTSKGAKTVEYREDVTRDGRRLYHVRATIDPKSKDLPDLAPTLAGPSELDVDEVAIDYYIGKDDRLIYRVELAFETVEDGEKIKMSIEADYHGYGAPPLYPADMPW